MWQETTRDQEEATHGTWGETTVPEAPALSTDFKVRLCSLCCLEWPNAHASFYSASWLSCYISLMHYSHNKNEFSSAVIFIFFNFYFYFILLYNTVLVLPYIDMNPPRIYMSSQTWTPLPPPTPYHLSGSSPCTIPKHPIFCIEHRLAIHFLHDSIHVSVSFSQMIPPSSSPSESKSPLYTSVSLLLSHIQGYHYIFLNSIYMH